MDFTQLIEVMQTMMLPTVAIACLVEGALIKNYLPLDNKHIPLIMALSGVGITALISGGFVSFEATVLSGALTGLASTGLHQLFSQYINKEGK